mmetsp:Transcript_59829/g.175535  ORF Transcript_59829/g.175535 Transcript_59829/m.175535 type:complete len:474 (+) Transcript_59829:171-1592(+)
MTIRERLKLGGWKQKAEASANRQDSKEERGRYAAMFQEETHERIMERRSVDLGVAKLTKHLFIAHNMTHCEIEQSSVYGAAIAIPQLARTTGWTTKMLVMTVKVYVFVVLNLFAQGGVLYMIFKEEMIWNLFGGQMYVCDFGAMVETCPEGPNCIGPDGTVFSPPRIYGWGQWAARMFARDSMKSIFPELRDKLGTLMDPGEYGLESFRCRGLCCFLFMIAVMGDLWQVFGMIKTLWSVPSKAEPWIEYAVPEWADKHKAKAVHDWKEFDLVRLKVAGMPRIWKLINVIVVLWPKMMIWKITSEVGITFLMETTSMDAVIVNATALIFVLNLDEIICMELMPREVALLLSKVEPKEIESAEIEALQEELETIGDDELLAQFDNEEHYSEGICHFLQDSVPVKLVVVTVLTWLFVHNYYWTHCFRNEQGGWVSVECHLPTGVSFLPQNAFFPKIFPLQKVPEAYWHFRSGDEID